MVSTVILAATLFIGGGAERIETGPNRVKYSDYAKAEVRFSFGPEWPINPVINFGHIERLNNDELGWGNDYFNSNYVEIGITIGE